LAPGKVLAMNIFCQLVWLNQRLKFIEGRFSAKKKYFQINFLKRIKRSWKLKLGFRQQN
jgi:hypothetical protein